MLAPVSFRSCFLKLDLLKIHVEDKVPGWWAQSMTTEDKKGL